MGHEDIRELLGAYALDAVDPDEAELVARHVEICPRCRAELREHREVAGLLGYAGEEAPAGLWDRIAASTQEPPPEMRLRVHGLPAASGPGASGSGASGSGASGSGASVVDIGRGRGSSRRRTLRMRTVAVLGVAAAVAVAVLGLQVARLDHRTSTLGKEVAASGPTMHAVDVALTVPGARKVTLAPVSTGQSAQAVVLPGGAGYLYDAKLTPLPPAETYQLWGINGSHLISYGILGNVPAPVVSFRAGPGAQVLAITAEAAGGVTSSTHAPIVSGKLSPPL